MKTAKVIGFDADDTLWVNENYFRETELEFCQLMQGYMPQEQTEQELFKTEMQNLELFGYGAKGFTLSLIETAVRISDGKIPARQLEQVVELGKKLILRPVKLLGGVLEVLHALQTHYQLVVVTKGDLLDQERKLQKSSLLPYFQHIEVMSDKKPGDYLKLIKQLRIQPSDFVMVGNSLKSDILPVVEIGAHAIYVPYHTTWQHEHAQESAQPTYLKAEKIKDILSILL